MSAVPHTYVRGACPGALQPMASGDGLIVRIRPRCGAIPIASAREIAAAAIACGNGLVDLTRRANLQLRGVRPEGLGALLARLDACGLIDRSAPAEAVRNVMVSPLAGADADEVLDVRPLALALEAALGETTELFRLPAKFGFIVDGGGTPSLDGERADIRLRAVRNGGPTPVAIGLDRPGGTQWLGATSPENAVAAALAVAMAYLDQLQPGSRARMRDLSQANVAAIAEAAPALCDKNGWVWDVPSQAGAGGRPLAQRNRTASKAITIAVAPPFGRLDAGQLADLANRAEAAGATELRLSPWRAVFVVVRDAQAADGLADWATRTGLIVNADDPRLAIDACPGAPACAAASLPTRDAALALSQRLEALSPLRSIHVSGCDKGCARSATADLVLVARGNRFAVIRDGLATSPADFTIDPAEIQRLPELLADRQHPRSERHRHG